MNGSIVDNAEYIASVIAEEDRNWIPSKGVEDFNFKWSQIRDLNWWFTSEERDWYYYLNRDDWYEVTVQTCELWYKKKRYYFVYVEKQVTDKNLNNPQESLVQDTQGLCHMFRWVRSLRHAMKLGEFWWILELQVSNPEEYYLTREEYDDAFRRD